MPLCMAHLARAWEYCGDVVYRTRRTKGPEWDAERIELANALLSEALAEHEREERAFLEWVHDPEVDDPDSVVYYVRFGDRIKIGYTRNLGQRLASIPHDELLTVEPGAVKVEANRHRQFATIRIVGEWFAAAPELIEHIDQIKARHAQRERWREKSAEGLVLYTPTQPTDAEILGVAR